MADHRREDWQSQAFRNKIVSKLEDEMKKNGTQLSKSSIEMEEYVFQRAGSREEYLDLVARVLLSVSNERTWNELCMEWVSMLAAANIPLSKTDHPAVQQFLKTRVGNGGAIPQAKQLQECYLNREKSQRVEEVKLLVFGKPIAIMTDEMSDANGRFVLNILGAPLELSSDGKIKSFLLDTVFLEKTNHSTVGQAVSKCLMDFGINLDDVVVFNTDNATYMKKAFQTILQGLCPNSVHITCLAHIMNLLGETFRKPFTEVNTYVKNMNAMFWHAGARKSRFLRHLAEVGVPAKMPPNPSGTRANPVLSRFMSGQGQSQNPGAGPAQGSQDPIGALQNLTGQAASGMERQGMMQGMHRMAPGRPHQMMPQQQPHMQHPRPQMQQQPPQLMRQDAFIVTSPQTMPGSQGQPMVSQNAAMMYQAPGGIMRSMGPTSMPHQYMQPGLPMPSPVGGSPLTMMPSPHGVMPSPAPRPYGVVSPSTNLHTPGTAVADSSPAPPNTSQEELAYMEKLHNMSKYIEPLRKSVQEYEKKTDEESIKSYNKMTKLLDILSNPKKRVSMAVLVKCEQALMKQSINVGSSKSNEQHMCQPLLNAIAKCSDASNLNHSLYRTFGPALETFKGSRIKAPSPPPAKKLKTEKEEDGGTPREELPDALQGEIARLDRKFQVSVDSRHHPGSQAFHLLCRLEDSRLPSVPPLQVTILKSYPKTSPQCDPSSCAGYDATELFKNVEHNLSIHLSHMPSRYCLTQLLVSWEMSVRKSCDPENPLLDQDNPIFIK